MIPFTNTATIGTFPWLNSNQNPIKKVNELTHSQTNTFLSSTFPWQVVALTLLTASGDILECSESENPELFQAACVHLGCLGIILTVTFQCVPEFYLQETTFPSTIKEVSELGLSLKRLWLIHQMNVTNHSGNFLLLNQKVR